MKKTRNVMEPLRSYSKKVVFNYIRVNERISRIELSQKTGMSATAITRLVNDFIEAGLVEEIGTCDVDSVGRKPVMLSVCRDCMYSVGINIDVDELAVGVVNMNGDIVYSAICEDFIYSDPDDVIRKVIDLYKRVFDNVDVPTQEKIIGIGVCVPGLVGWPAGNTKLTPQLHWNSFPLRKTLQDALGIDVLVDNNVKASAMAEAMFGGVRELDSFFVVEVGSGLGAALVLDGKVMRGNSGLLGEIGHALAVEDGELCDCGRKGCLQAYICITGLEHRLDMPIAQILAHRNDERVRAVLKDAIHYLSVTIANVVNYYDPGAIVLHGRLFKLWPELFYEVSEHSQKLLWHPSHPVMNLKMSDIHDKNMRILSAASVFFNDLLLPEAVVRNSALQPEARMM